MYLSMTVSADELQVIPVKSNSRISNVLRRYMDLMVHNLSRLVHSISKTYLT